MPQEQIALQIAGMSCQHCVETVRAALAGVPGVTNVQVDLAGATAQVAYDSTAVNVMKLMQAVKAAGFSATGFQRVR